MSVRYANSLPASSVEISPRAKRSACNAATLDAGLKRVKRRKIENNAELFYLKQ